MFISYHMFKISATSTNYFHFEFKKNLVTTAVSIAISPPDSTRETMAGSICIII